MSFKQQILLAAFVGGTFGLHRFLVAKWISGLIMALGFLFSLIFIGLGAWWAWRELSPNLLILGIIIFIFQHVWLARDISLIYRNQWQGIPEP